MKLSFQVIDQSTLCESWVCGVCNKEVCASHRGFGSLLSIRGMMMAVPLSKDRPRKEMLGLPFPSASALSSSGFCL